MSPSPSEQANHRMVSQDHSYLRLLPNTPVENAWSSISTRLWSIVVSRYILLSFFSFFFFFSLTRSCGLQVVQQADFIVPVEIEYHWHHFHVLKRPGVDEFLRRMGEIYEVVIFTASLSKVYFPFIPGNKTLSENV
jgi:hypothetical protein